MNKIILVAAIILVAGVVFLILNKTPEQQETIYVNPEDIACSAKYSYNTYWVCETGDIFNSSRLIPIDGFVPSIYSQLPEHLKLIYINNRTPELLKGFIINHEICHIQKMETNQSVDECYDII